MGKLFSKNGIRDQHFGNDCWLGQHTPVSASNRINLLQEHSELSQRNNSLWKDTQTTPTWLPKPYRLTSKLSCAGAPVHTRSSQVSRTLPTSHATTTLTGTCNPNSKATKSRSLGVHRTLWPKPTSEKLKSSVHGFQSLSPSACY